MSGIFQEFSIRNEKQIIFYIVSVTKQTFYTNYISRRQKSSATDGNFHSVKMKPTTRDKYRKFRMLKTNVTQGMNEKSATIFIQFIN